MSDSTNKNPFEQYAQTGTPFESLQQRYEVQKQINPSLVLLNSLPDEERAKALQLATEINHNDYESVLSFGRLTQEKLSQFTNIMLKQTQKKDIINTGSLLNDLLNYLDKIDPEALLPKEKSFFGKLFNKKQPVIQEIISDYTRLKIRIDRLSIQLEHAQLQLLKDNQQLNELYDLNVQFFKQVNQYIAACEVKLHDLRENVLPSLEAKMKSTFYPLDEQAYRDLHMQIEWIDKRKYDLEISREIAIQSAPQIRMIQQTGQMLMEKIQSSVLTTIPIWQSQIALILQMNKQRKLAESEQKMISASEKLSKKNHDMYSATKHATNGQINSTSNELLRFKETQLQLLKNIEETLAIQQQATNQLQ